MSEITVIDERRSMSCMTFMSALAARASVDSSPAQAQAVASMKPVRVSDTATSHAHHTVTFQRNGQLRSARLDGAAGRSGGRAPLHPVHAIPLEHPATISDTGPKPRRGRRYARAHRPAVSPVPQDGVLPLVVPRPTRAVPVHTSTTGPSTTTCTGPSTSGTTV